MCQCGVWLRPNQRTMDRIRAAFAALKTPYYRTAVTLSNGKKCGHNLWQLYHFKALDAKRGATKIRQYTSLVGRWQHNENFRASQLAQGSIETWVKYLDFISEIDITHNALYRQRQALIPRNREDHCVNDQIIDHQQMFLSAFNEIKARVYLQFRYT